MKVNFMFVLNFHFLLIAAYFNLVQVKNIINIIPLLNNEIFTLNTFANTFIFLLTL